MAREFDVVIIGAGPGGYTAALKAAEFGLKVANLGKGFKGEGEEKDKADTHRLRAL